jgi:pilus assembly protein CpaE
MIKLNNYIVITNKSNCYRWLNGLNDSLANLIFVEPDNKERINSLLDSVEVSAVLIHLLSQVSSTELVPEDGKSPGISAILTLLETQEASSTIVSNDDTSLGLSDDLAMIESLLHSRPQLTVIGLVDTINHTLLLPIMRAGARDLIKIGTPAYETSAIIARHNKRSAVPEQAEKPVLGHVTTLLNARAEDSTALLAIHLALEMQRSAPTLLIDLGVPHADIMLIMGVPVKFNFLDVIKNSSRLDSTLIQTGFAKHSSGLTLLPMPENSEEAEITPTEVYLVLHALKSHFKYILINLGGLCNTELLKVVFSTTNSTLFLLEQTVPSCKRNYDLLQSLREQKIATPNPKLIVDRYKKNASPNAESIAKSLEIPLLCKLPSLGNLRLLAMNTGESMFEFAPKSTYVRSIKKMAQELIGVEEVNEEKSFKSFKSFIIKIQNLLVARN